MKRVLGIILSLWLLGVSGSGEAAAPPPPEPVTMMSDSQWGSVLKDFEDSAESFCDTLDKIQIERRKLEGGIQKLEGKIGALRRKTQEKTNVIDEIRLKSMLSDLKEKLEQNSDLRHEWDAKQKEFEQKALSLGVLYNQRIENLLGNNDSSATPESIDSRLRLLTSLAQKRAKIKIFLKKYKREDASENPPPVASVESIRADDQEGLQLTLDLLRDRKRELENQLEKWSLDEEEALNEVKLQSKMQEFLEDVRRVNEDATSPRKNRNNIDLDRMVGTGQRSLLGKKLTDLKAKIFWGQESLDQIVRLSLRVQHQMDSLNERKRK